MTAPGIPAIVPKLIARLSSPFDHEVISTARSIGRILESNKLDWNDLAEAVTAPPPTRWEYKPPRSESDIARQMREWLEVISRETWLNDWTRSFIANILTRQSLDSLSAKQRTCAQNIITEAYRRGVRVDRRAA
jgi:hypothetical protein